MWFFCKFALCLLGTGGIDREQSEGFLLQWGWSRYQRDLGLGVEPGVGDVVVDVAKSLSSVLKLTRLNKQSSD